MQYIADFLKEVKEMDSATDVTLNIYDFFDDLPATGDTIFAITF